MIEKLENYKVEHQDKENEVVGEISGMNKKIDEVKSNLENRTRELGLIYEYDETDGNTIATPPIIHELRRSCSVPSEPNTPDCDVFLECNPMNQSYSTLTVDKGLIKFDKPAVSQLVEESINSLSTDAIPDAAIEKTSGQTFPTTTRGYSPPPEYSESTLFSNTRAITIDYS